MNINLRTDKIEKFDEIQDGLSYLVGEPNVSITQLMNNKFVAENTNFHSWSNLLEAAGVTNEKDFETARFNEFIKAHTRFEEWEEMLVQASNQYAARKDSEELDSSYKISAG